MSRPHSAFFSGSAESLALALNLSGEKDEARDDLLHDLRFHIVTGSATAPGLEDRLGGKPQFDRTVLSDDILQREALTFFHQKLGWNVREIGLLAESDTAYGTGNLDLRLQSHFTVMKFPSGVSDLRAAWEKDGKLLDSQEDGAPIKPTASTIVASRLVYPDSVASSASSRC